MVNLTAGGATAVLRSNLIQSIEFGTAVARRLKRASNSVHKYAICNMKVGQAGKWKRVKLFKEKWPMLRKRTFLKNHKSTMDNGHI